jgi:hypothetical protein
MPDLNAVKRVICRVTPVGNPQQLRRCALIEDLLVRNRSISSPPHFALTQLLSTGVMAYVDRDFLPTDKLPWGAQKLASPALASKACTPVISW